MRLRSRIRWWMSPRCTCREHKTLGGTVQVGGVLHRGDGPCFHCDGYGNPIDPFGDDE